MESTSSTDLDTVLLTGAAGTLGRVLVPSLRGLCRRLVLSDLPAACAGLSAAPASGGLAEVVVTPCDLADGAAVHALLAGVQAVVHLGGVSTEQPFDVIAPANLHGVFHLYDAARRQGTRRIVFASSNHVSGCRATGETVTPEHPPRPDGLYGVSKLFGEGLARLYWDRAGIESVCLRIGSALPRPVDRRGLSTWLSWPDLARLVTASLTTPDVGFVVAYGISANTRRWWDTQAAWDRIGYVPQDDAEAYAAEVAHVAPPDDTPMARLQGGAFLGMGDFGPD